MLLLLACALDVASDSPKAPDSAAPVDTQVDTQVDSQVDSPVDTQGDSSVDSDVIDSAPIDTGDSVPVDTEETAVEPDAVPDFLLADVNPNSPRYEEMLSPRDYIGQVAGFYFTHAT